MNEIERVHIFSLVIWKSSFVKCLFKFLAHFQFGYLFLLFYRNFYILGIQPFVSEVFLKHFRMWTAFALP